VRGVVGGGFIATPRQRERLVGRGESGLGLLLRGARDGGDVGVGEVADGVDVRELAFVGAGGSGEQQQQEQGDERDAAHDDFIGRAVGR
jgi:hypothetical protein